MSGLSVARNFTSRELAGVINICKKDGPCSVFRGRIPARKVTSEKEKVEFRGDLGTEPTAAPFVVPCDDYQAVDYDSAIVALEITPATIGLENELHSCDTPLPQAANEVTEWHTLSHEQKYLRHVGMLLQKQEQSRQLRMELMYRDALVNGKLLIEQENKQGEVVSQNMVDFDRSPRLNIRLAGKATWDNIDTADPISDLEALEARMIDEGGSEVRRFFVGKNVYAKMIANKRVREDVKHENGKGRLDADLDWQPGTVKGVARRGSIANRWEIWTVNCTYRDRNGVKRDYLPPNAVIALGDGDCGPQFVELFGAVRQVDKRLPVEVFRWNEIDKSARRRWQKFGFESHPMVAPLNANGAAIMYVLPEEMA